MHPIVFGLNLPSLGRIDGWMVKCQTAENLSSTHALEWIPGAPLSQEGIQSSHESALHV